MAVSNEKMTTFSNDPKKGREVVDAYKSDQMSKFLEGSTKSIDPNLLSDSFPDLKADQIEGVLTDPEMLDFMAEAELSPQEMVTSVVNSLPPGVKLKDLAGEISMPKLLSFTDGLRETLGSKKWAKLDSDFFKSMYHTYEDYGSVFAEGESWPDLLKKVGLANLNGVATQYGVDVNAVADAAYKLGVTEELMQSGMADDAISWIDDSTIPAELKELIYRDMAGTAAETGNSSKTGELIEKAGSSWKPHHAIPTVKKILGGYRIEPGTPIKNYPELAKVLVDRCNTISENWYLTDMGGEKVGTSNLLGSASEHTLIVLQYDSRTKYIAATYRHFRPITTSWKRNARKKFPYLTF